MTDRSGQRIGVVLIDDHKMFAQSLARMFAAEPDIDVLGMVYNSVDAAGYVAMIRPDVVLIDYQMPERDGIRVTADIKATNPETSVVMLTESDHERVLVAAIEAGCSGFVTKDASIAEVTEAIRSAAAGQAILSPSLLARLLPRFNRNSNHHSPGSDLTRREREILNLLAAGWATPEISVHLAISVNTIRNHVHSILTKLGAHSRIQAVSIALSANLIDHVSSPGERPGQRLARAPGQTVHHV